MMRFHTGITFLSTITFSVFKIIWKEGSADRFGGNYTESPYNLICNCIVLVQLSVSMSAFLQVCYVQNDSQYSII